jgi:hypothetical protein
MEIILPRDILSLLEKGPKTRAEIREELIYGHLQDVPGDWLRTAWHRVCVSFASLSRYKTRHIDRLLEGFLEDTMVVVLEDKEWYALDRFHITTTGRYFLCELRLWSAAPA